MFRYLILFLFFYSSLVISSEEYCVQRMPQYEEKLNAREICQYSNSCLNMGKKNKLIMYCDLPNLSECFEEKAWLGKHDYLGVSKSVTIKGTSKRFKKTNGKMKKIFCGTNKKVKNNNKIKSTKKLGQ